MTMKRIAFLLVMVGILFFSSCKKDQEMPQFFRGYCERNEMKTSLNNDGHSLMWDSDNEVIKIWGNADNNWSTYIEAELRDIDEDHGWANFYALYCGEDRFVTPFRAGYPTCYWKAYNKVHFPYNQFYRENNLDHFPMYSVSSDEEFRFKNLCGVVKLRLQKTGYSVSAISITTDRKNVSGDFWVSMDSPNDVPTLTEGNGCSTVTLRCPQPVDIDQAKDFYIYLPPNVYSSFKIEIFTSDGSYTKISSQNNQNITVNRNKILTLIPDPNSIRMAPNVIVPGYFDVNASHDQIRFSYSNVKYTVGGEPDPWFFGNGQTDYSNTYSANVWSYFGRCVGTPQQGSGSGAVGASSSNNSGMLTSENDADYAGSFVDWSFHFNPNDREIPWRTIRAEEWQYIISARDNYEDLRALATISGVTGLLLLPDEWNYCYHNYDEEFGIEIDRSFNNYSDNELTTEQLNTLTMAGAVFLPAAGKRVGATVSEDGSKGYYWTDQEGVSSNAGKNLYFSFSPSDSPIVNTGYNASTGLSVRLVKTTAFHTHHGDTN